MKEKVKAFIAKVPAPVKVQAIAVAKHFGTSFAGSFVVLYPGILAAPSFSAGKSLAVAAVLSSATAAVRSTAPFAKAAVVKLFASWGT
jgi:hypothetical protein